MSLTAFSATINNMKTKLLQVAIVGRANVGKSTLFNRLVEKNKALVSNFSGTTRDLNIDKVNWQGKQFILIDTGGLDIDQGAGEIEKNVVKQAQKAIGRADLILFLIDVRSGILPQDKELAKEIIKKGLKNQTILVANKADSSRWRQPGADAYRLNLGEPQMVSAASGSGCGDLLDLIVKKLSLKNLTETEEKTATKITIVGKPNVGKSSLINSILGEERLIVTDIAHTTREAHDLEFNYQDHDFILIDTAGIRRKSKINSHTLEKKSILKSLKAIGEADVVILITEVNKRIDMQDKKITQEILDQGKPVIIVANKWDLIKDKNTKTVDEFIKYYQGQFPYLRWAPIIFVSAKEGQRTKKILELVLAVQKASRAEIGKKDLELFLKSQVKQHRPSRGKGLKNPFIYKIEQIKTNPPRFLLTVNDPAILHFSYLRFLQNNLRKKFNLTGTPIQFETQKYKQARNK